MVRNDSPPPPASNAKKKNYEYFNRNFRKVLNVVGKFRFFIDGSTCMSLPVLLAPPISIFLNFIGKMESISLYEEIKLGRVMEMVMEMVLPKQYVVQHHWGIFNGFTKNST